MSSEFTDPDQAIEALAERLRVMPSERIPAQPGRVLAAPLHADRDSPAIDVSAMDGYAIRHADLQSTSLMVAGEMQPGQPPLTLAPGTALRIFTGAAIPLQADTVVIREHTDEASPEKVVWRDEAKLTKLHANIRFRGENGKAGAEVLSSGTLLTPASVSATASFGATDLPLHAPVRVAVLVTGNELLDRSQQPEPWQLRDSNGPTVVACCDRQPWIHCSGSQRCSDNADQLRSQLTSLLPQHDAIVLTGGVSKGDYDHVPAVIASLGARIVFHRLPIRPGRPILGAVTGEGQLILGLPGNPVSALVCMRRFGLPLLAKMSGQRNWRPIAEQVQVDDPKQSQLPLHWFRLVHRTHTATAELLDSKGSGDLVALAQSTGFIYQPPHSSGAGLRDYFAW